MKRKTILSIESSCDETAAAVMQEGVLIGHSVASQLVHEKYGGVVPEFAARAHQVNIIPVVKSALQKANVTIEEIDVVGVTQGPGLLGSLLVGVAFANGLALARNIPVIGIHHTRAHLLANFLELPYPSFPFLGLVVSGGHTQLAEVKSPLKMDLLGTTLDDAVGEAFDKIGKMMGFPYPAGKFIDMYAAEGDPGRFSFPIARVEGLDFSFSGIKTAFLYFLKKQKETDFLNRYKKDLCASIQATLVATLIKKVEKALIERNFTQIVVGGGVASNRLLRMELKKIAQKNQWKVFIPDPIYCTDNAAMVAMATHYAIQADNTKIGHFIVPEPRLSFSPSSL